MQNGDLASPHGAATVPRSRALRRAAASACPAWIPTIRATGGCATAATPTITLLGFAGPKAEAEEIKTASGGSSCVTNSSWNCPRTRRLITHARTGAARFLGYEITIQHNDTQDHRTARRSTGTIALRVPTDVIKAKCAPYLQRGKPATQNAADQRATTTPSSATYGAEYRGIVQYYLLAGDVFRLNRLRWVMETSMLKTLAAKHRSTVSKMAAKHKAKIETPHGPRTCFEATHRARRQATTGRTVRRDPAQTAEDRRSSPTASRPADLPAQGADHATPRGQCELCGQTDDIASPPRPHARRPRNRPGRRQPAVGTAHGQATPQDPRGLRRLPRPHPPAAAAPLTQ